MNKDIKIARTWDEVNPVLYDLDEPISTRILEKKYRDTMEVALALRDYIDSIPKEIEISSATGCDRDWVDRVLSKENRA